MDLTLSELPDKLKIHLNRELLKTPQNKIMSSCDHFYFYFIPIKGSLSVTVKDIKPYQNKIDRWCKKFVKLMSNFEEVERIIGISPQHEIPHVFVKIRMRMKSQVEKY
jgi:hypothetical protein